MEIFGADKNRGQVTGRSKNQTSPYDRRDDCEPASVADVFRFRDQTSEGNPIAWCLRLHRNELNSHLCGLGPAMASAFDIASQFFSRILVEVLKNVAIRAARSSCQLNTFGKGIQIVNQRIWLVRMDLTRHRSAKKVAVPDRLTQLLDRTKISLERMGM